MKFTNLSPLLNPKPPPMPKFDTHTQLSIIPIFNGQNFKWFSIGMNKLWGKIEAYLKWVLIGVVGKPFFLASVKLTNELSSLLKMVRREKRFLQIERGSMREKEREDLWERNRERESLPLDIFQQFTFVIRQKEQHTNLNINKNTNRYGRRAINKYWIYIRINLQIIKNSQTKCMKNEWFRSSIVFDTISLK